MLVERREVSENKNFHTNGEQRLQNGTERAVPVDSLYDCPLIADCLLVLNKVDFHSNLTTVIKMAGGGFSLRH